jgi:AcrR family transcriptional regulator
LALWGVIAVHASIYTVDNLMDSGTGRGVWSLIETFALAGGQGFMTQKHRSTEVRKKQITDAARKLIIKKGSEHITVRNIAKEVKFSEAAIYRHFKSKRDILLMLATQITDNLLQDIDNAEPGAGNSLDRINSILRTHLSTIEQRRGISFLVLAEIISLGDKRLNKQLYNNLQIYVSRLKKLLADGASAGQVRENLDLDAASLILFGMIQGLVNVWALSNYGFDLMDKYSALWEVFRGTVVTE